MEVDHRAGLVSDLAMRTLPLTQVTGRDNDLEDEILLPLI